MRSWLLIDDGEREECGSKQRWESTLYNFPDYGCIVEGGKRVLIEEDPKYPVQGYYWHQVWHINPGNNPTDQRPIQAYT